MMSKLRMLAYGSAFCALMLFISSESYAGTIIKLNLGGVGPDVAMDAGGTLGTVPDGDVPPTTGNQNTAVEYTGFLDIPLADIGAPIASYTMSNLQANGPAQQFGSLVIQGFTGGSFSLFDAANALVLSGSLTNSTLSGVVGPPGTGGLFTTSVSTVTGGWLQPFILPNSLSLSMNLSSINGGAGLSVIGGPAPVLNAFQADAFVNISGDPDPTGGDIPEPASLLLLLTALSGVFAVRRR